MSLPRLGAKRAGFDNLQRIDNRMTVGKAFPMTVGKAFHPSFTTGHQSICTHSCSRLAGDSKAGWSIVLGDGFSNSSYHICAICIARESQSRTRGILGADARYTHGYLHVLDETVDVRCMRCSRGPKNIWDCTGGRAGEDINAMPVCTPGSKDVLSINMRKAGRRLKGARHRESSRAVRYYCKY